MNVDFINNIENKDFVEATPAIIEALEEKFNNNVDIVSYMNQFAVLEELSQHLDQSDLSCLKEACKKNESDDDDDDDSDDDKDNKKKEKEDDSDDSDDSDDDDSNDDSDDDDDDDSDDDSDDDDDDDDGDDD